MAGTSKILLFVVGLLCLSSAQVYSQKLSIKLADNFFDEYKFSEAINLYEYCYQRDTANQYVVRRLAEANRNMGNSEADERWLKHIITSQTKDPVDIFNYAQALRSNGKYLLAEKWLKQYSLLKPDDSRIVLQESTWEYVQSLMKDSANYKVFNTSINTKGSDMGPTFYKGRLIFSSTARAQYSIANEHANEMPNLDMYSALISPYGDLSSVDPFAPKLRTLFHDGPASIDEKNGIIYFTRNNIVKNKILRSKNGVVNLQIFEGKLENGEWNLKGSLSINSDEYSVVHPSISRNGKILFFASDMPGGFGGMDIYYCVSTNGKWGSPINLGSQINTKGNELFPFISNDDVLYFASDGHGGIGGLDIFSAIERESVFTEVKNLGFPINSSKDDFGLALDSTGVKGYFVSNRNGGKGDDDIYFMKIKRTPIHVTGVVKDIDTGNTLSDATISVINENEVTILNSQSQSSGQFNLEINKGLQYRIVVNKESYIPKKIILPTGRIRINGEASVEIFMKQKTFPQGASGSK